MVSLTWLLKQKPGCLIGFFSFASPCPISNQTCSLISSASEIYLKASLLRLYGRCIGPVTTLHLLLCPSNQVPAQNKAATQVSTVEDSSQPSVFMLPPRMYSAAGPCLSPPLPFAMRLLTPRAAPALPPAWNGCPRCPTPCPFHRDGSLLSVLRVNAIFLEQPDTLSKMRFHPLLSVILGLCFLYCISPSSELRVCQSLSMVLFLYRKLHVGLVHHAGHSTSNRAAPADQGLLCGGHTILRICQNS